jgi:hypothetical protein
MVETIRDVQLTNIHRSMGRVGMADAIKDSFQSSTKLHRLWWSKVNGVFIDAPK